MSRKISLHLEDVLEDSPQTRCMLNVFENDAQKVNEYMSGLHEVLERLVSAQTQVASVVSDLGNFLNAYKLQNFPLEHNENDFPVTVDKFHGTITELSSWMEIVCQQLNNCSLYPVTKFIREMNDLQGRKDVFHSIGTELDASILKYAKLSKKDVQTKKGEEISEELKANRKRFHLAGLHYYENLNKLQFSRRIALLEPILSVIYAFRSFCHVGHQALTQDKELFDFFTRTQEQLQSLHNEQESEWNSYQDLIKNVNEIERLNPLVYDIEHPTEKILSPETPPAENVVNNSANNNNKNGTTIDNNNGGEHNQKEDITSLQKQGYLFLKLKSALLNKWDRLYFFIQSGNLMAQTRDEIAGKSAFELTPCVKASTSDRDDDHRRYTFNVTCYKTKRQIVLQAANDDDRRQWIDAINAAACQAVDGSFVGSGQIADDAIAPPTSESAAAATKTSAETNIGSTGKAKSGKIQSKTSPIDPDEEEPIQFDLLTSNSSTTSLDENSNDSSLVAAATEENSEKFAYRCAVKFLGSLDVADDRDDKLIKQATEKILRTRQKFNISKYVDLIMLVEKQERSTMTTVDGVKAEKSGDVSLISTTNQKMARFLLVDGGGGDNAALKAAFRLDDLSSWSPTVSDKSIVALVVRTKMDRSDGRHRFTCYLLEAADDKKSQEICENLTKLSRQVFESLIQQPQQQQQPKSVVEEDKKIIVVHQDDLGSAEVEKTKDEEKGEN